ncbi:hypothetical protein F5890DRAFT_1498213 [Lentinula detonsa]|uniref:Fanconi-associated nuclease n=1 Tax=Lentinula detonsa TaxID=2804962 RepID=A0AA38UUV1_9AGAR|nr:hypothetical protein F5890DRAFT_1498213 [Lentinula detonsa]
MNNATTQLVFGSQRIVETADELATLLDGPPIKGEEKPEVPRFESRNKQSPYVSVFEDIVNQIYNFESNLLSKEEGDALVAFRKLKYSSMYILIRLALRKPAWHTRKSLNKYVSEVGDWGINLAVKELCIPIFEILERPDVVNVKEEEEKVEVKIEHEVIDLTEDSEVETTPSISNRLCKRSCSAPSSPPEPQHLSFFCENEARMTLDEALAKLSLDEVKILVKDYKVRAKLNTKDALIQALKRNAQIQGDLSTMIQTQGKQRGLRQTQLNFGAAPPSSITQEGRLQQMAVKKLGSCLRVNPAFHKLLRRLDIIFYRSTSIPETVFLNSFLTIFKKRTYPSYTSARSTIWPTRDAYLDYEEGLELQAVFDLILDDTIVKPKGSTPPVGLNTRFRTPVGTGSQRLAEGSADGAVKLEENEVMQGVFVEPEEVDVSGILSEGFKPEEHEEDNKPRASSERQLAAARVIEIYHSILKSKWEFCVSAARSKPENERDPSLERFEQGYVLTRLLYKVAEAYALLHQYDKELEVLRLLLDQRFWRQAKRGKWYERRALVQDRHLPSLYRSRAEQNGWNGQHLLDKKQQLLDELREGLYEGMEDKDTHRVYHKSLVKRLTKVESRMKIPFDAQHTYNVQLRDANDVCVFAHRAENIPWTGERTQHWQAREKQSVITNWLIRGGFAYVSDDSEEVDEALPKPPSHTGKSVWKTLDGSSTCNVETRALQYYAEEKYGQYKGFHSETCILTTIFALLFWDIIFADIPGAFETAYQIAPLDLVEDSFYYARKEIIESRLKELKDGKALDILEKHERLYRESKTWCVGVRWDVCGKDELAEIVECMGRNALVVICELFCQDYPARASGVPDLILWKYEERKCKFVEVKGPGDRARENQTLWFDTLLGAGLDVDLCRVLEYNTKNINVEKEKRDQREAREEKARVKKEKGKTKGQRKGRKVKREELYSDNEDGNIDPDDNAVYRGLEKVDELNLIPSFTKGKRYRSLEDDEDDLDSRSVLTTSQDKVMSQDWSAEPIFDIPTPKRLKTGEQDLH